MFFCIISSFSNCGENRKYRSSLKMYITLSILDVTPTRGAGKLSTFSILSFLFKKSYFWPNSTPPQIYSPFEVFAISVQISRGFNFFLREKSRVDVYMWPSILSFVIHPIPLNSCPGLRCKAPAPSAGGLSHTQGLVSFPHQWHIFLFYNS